MCKTVDDVNKRICCSCGLCEGICSFDAISFRRNEQGNYVPVIDKSRCKKCGICYEICPGDKISDKKIFGYINQSMPSDLIKGHVIDCFNAKVNDAKLLENSTSGGMVTGIVSYLLARGKFDAAFCVDTYDYSNQVKTNIVTDANDLFKTLQSRYVTVSHSNLAKYICTNRDKKLIIIAVGCAMAGIRYIMEEYKLDPSNYLCLGLFCACSYSYRTWDYFKLYNKHKPLKELQFRSKNGKRYAYGMIKARYGNDIKVMHTIHRAYIKSDFSMERCWYCTDLLNVYADISFGDNNTKSKDGESCTVIVRSENGNSIMQEIENNGVFVKETISADDIKDARYRSKRELYANIFEMLNGIRIYKDREIHPDGILIPLCQEYKKMIEKRNWALDVKNTKKLWLINQLRYLKLRIFNRSYLAELPPKSLK